MNENRRLYNQLAATYDLRQQNPSTVLLRQNEEKLIKKYSRGLVLDLGCGTGYHLNLADNIFGLDISEKQLSIAKQSGRPLIHAEIENLPIKTNSIDTILCFYSTLNFVDLDKTAREISRILKTGGIALISPTSVKDADKNSKSKTKNFRLEGHRVKMELYEKSELEEKFREYGMSLIYFNSLFRGQKARWGNFKRFSFWEKIKLKLGFLFQKENGRVYVMGFKKLL